MKKKEEEKFFGCNLYFQASIFVFIPVVFNFNSSFKDLKKKKEKNFISSIVQ
jgi:hypothetical protein